MTGLVTVQFVLKCLYETYYGHVNSSIRSCHGLRHHKRGLVLMTPKEIWPVCFIFIRSTNRPHIVVL